MGYYDNDVPFSALLGKTVTGIRGLEVGSECVDFACGNENFRLYHRSDCCESVDVAEIIGDVEDLLGAPLVEAEEVSNADDPENWKPEYQPESHTWTFYKLRTSKGCVVIRWLGSSNGYYSETAVFEKCDAA